MESLNERQRKNPQARNEHARNERPSDGCDATDSENNAIPARRGLKCPEEPVRVGHMPAVSDYIGIQMEIDIHHNKSRDRGYRTSVPPKGVRVVFIAIEMNCVHFRLPGDLNG